MSMHFQLPNFQVQTPGERKMYSYLYQTVQQLNWAMEQLQQTPAQEVVYGMAVSAGNAEQSGPAPVSEETFRQLKGLIIKSADIVNAYYETIRTKLQGQYAAQSEFGSFVRDTELSLEANGEGIAQNFTSIQSLQLNTGAMADKMTGVGTNLETVRSDVAELQNQAAVSQQELMSVQQQLGRLHGVQQETSAYIKTGMISQEPDGTPVYGLEIGQTNEVGGQEVFNKYARFSSSRLSFYDQNDTEVAYISDYKLYITNVQITGTLKAGSFTLDTADGLAFRWEEGSL